MSNRITRTYDIYTPKSLSAWDVQCPIDGEWQPARPEPFHSLLNRLRLAWLVLTYRADVLLWPGQESARRRR